MQDIGRVWLSNGLGPVVEARVLMGVRLLDPGVYGLTAAHSTH